MRNSLTSLVGRAAGILRVREPLVLARQEHRDGTPVQPWGLTGAADSFQVSMLASHPMGRGRVKLQTISHSPVGYAVESGMLDDQEAMHHEERHVVSNIIGTPEMRIEIGPPIDLATYDTLLVATDGLADNLHIEEIIERIEVLA